MEDLIKGELDWHNKVNENFHEVDSQMADIAINVKAYGANMGASADSSNIIQNLIDNVYPHLFVPKGIILLSSINFRDKNVIIEGTGCESVIVIDNIPTDKHGLYSNECGNVLFKNIKIIIKDGSNLGTGNQGAALAFRYGAGVTFDNVTFDASNLPDNATCCIHIRKLKYFIFNNCHGNYKKNFILGMGINNDNGNTQINTIIINMCDFRADKGSSSFFNVDNEPDEYPIIGIINDMYAYINGNRIIKELQDDNSPHEGLCFGIGYSRNVNYTRNKIVNYDNAIDLDNPDTCFIIGNTLINKGTISTTGIGIRVGTDDGGAYTTHKRNTNVNISNNIISGFNIGITSDHGTLLSIFDNIISKFNIAFYFFEQNTSKIYNNQCIFNNGSSFLHAIGFNNSKINKNEFHLAEDIDIIQYLFWLDNSRSTTYVYIIENILYTDLDHVAQIFLTLGNNSNNILIDRNININILNTNKTLNDIHDKLVTAVGGMELNINGTKYKISGAWGIPVDPNIIAV